MLTGCPGAQPGAAWAQSGAAGCSQVQQGAARCNRVQPGWARSPNAGRVPRCSMGTAGAASAQPGAAGCGQGARVQQGAAGCSKAQQGRSRRRRRRAARCSWAPQGRSRRLRKDAPGVQQGCSRRNGCHRGRCVKSCEELRKAAPQGRTRGAAGVQPAQRVPQGALSDKLRRTSETNKKTGALPYQGKTLLSLIRLRSISPDAKACAEKLDFRSTSAPP